MPVQSNVLTSALSSLSTSTGNAVSDLSGVAAGADVLASQFADVKVALQNLQTLANAMRESGYYTPVGSIVPFAGAVGVVPTGWLPCDGQGYVTTGTYANLFAVIGVTYGSSGGFQVPDLRGRTIAGIDTTGFTNTTTYPTRLASISDSAFLSRVIGDVRIPTHGHANTIVYTQNDHTHGFTTGDANANHTHTTGFRAAQVAAGSHTRALVAPDATYSTTTTYQTSGWDANHQHSGTTGGASTNVLNKSGGVTDYSGGSGVNIPPTMMLNYIIKY